MDRKEKIIRKKISKALKGLYDDTESTYYFSVSSYDHELRLYDYLPKQLHNSMMNRELISDICFEIYSKQISKFVEDTGDMYAPGESIARCKWRLRYKRHLITDSLMSKVMRNHFAKRVLPIIKNAEYLDGNNFQHLRISDENLRVIERLSKYNKQLQKEIIAYKEKIKKLRKLAYKK